MPLLSQVSQQTTDEKGDGLHNSDSTALETITSTEGGEMSTPFTDEESEHSGASSKGEGDSDILSDHYLLTSTLESTNKFTNDEVKEKDVIDVNASGKLLPRTPVRSIEDNSAESAFREENQNSDSSDDESSYFRDPRNLPDPKSDRRYSFSGFANDKSRGPDLSLSFSEDSDEIHHHHHLSTQNCQDLEVSELFTPSEIERKTWLYNSIQSGAGSDDDLSSDPSIRNELINAASQLGRLPTSVPSGRKSPVLGEHPPSRGNLALSSPSSAGLDPSPPTISSAYQQNRGYLHPQAQTISQDQLADWLVAADAAYEQQLMGVNPYLFEDLKRNNSLLSGSFHSNANSSEFNAEKLEEELSEALVQKYADSFVQGIGEPLVAIGTEQSFRSNKGRSIGNRVDEQPSVGTFAYDVATAADQQGYKQMSPEHDMGDKGEFKVYWKRWIMLMYMSVLNLLSDWTCYSVAPIALLTEQAFGSINPELLVTVFLVANAVASACEPIILSRLGLRRTVLFGALLLMIGSIVKSGGMPPIIKADLKKGQGEWRVYVGFLLVGLSQPLYQCTPALLSASWFPDVERTMATGIALNANQLGIGFAFIFGTLLVVDSDDIPPYFGLLSIVSTVTFFGVLMQFEDAPPTPPSDSARVMKGSLDVKLPSVRSMFDSIRKIGVDRPDSSSASSVNQKVDKEAKGIKHAKPPEEFKESVATSVDSAKGVRLRYVSDSESLNGEKRPLVREGAPTTLTSTAAVPSSTYDDKTIYFAPSPSNVGAVSTVNKEGESENDEVQGEEQVSVNPRMMHPYSIHGRILPRSILPGYSIPNPLHETDNSLSRGDIPPYLSAQNEYDDEFLHSYPDYQYVPHQIPYLNQSFDQFAYYQIPHASYGSVRGAKYQNYNYPPHLYHTEGYHYGINPYSPSYDALDEGTEPVLILTPHHLDINIRDDQVLLSIKACMARKGFIHSLVSFTVSGVVINTLSTFMDYLVRLNGAGREYTGIVGGTFQFGIMISSLIVGKVCDTTRAYYSITIFMLVLGAFGLAQCGVSLDEARGNDLRWALVVVALLVGPLQPISTELGVEVAYPLSENTVLVIQQLFSNLLSAMFIPCFKAMKDISLGHADAEIPVSEKPEYTFSFYLLIVLHAGATVFFATFNGRYLRHDHEIEKATMANRRARYSGAFRLVDPETQSVTEAPNETTPIISPGW